VNPERKRKEASLHIADFKTGTPRTIGLSTREGAKTLKKRERNKSRSLRHKSEDKKIGGEKELGYLLALRTSDEVGKRETPKLLYRLLLESGWATRRKETKIRRRRS